MRRHNKKLNVWLLRKIQAHITEEPRRFFMDWFEVHGNSTAGWFFKWRDLASTVPSCGTAACIAGWANGLTGARQGDWDDLERAMNKLGIEEDWRKGSKNTTFNYVIDFNYWPSPYAARYGKARTPKMRAKVACQRIDHLIATGE